MVVILAVVDYFDDLFIVVVAKVEVANFGSSCLFATFFHTATYFEREPPFCFFRAHFTKCVFASGPVRRKSEGCVS